MIPGVLIGIYYAFLDRVIALHGSHALFYNFALSKIIENRGGESQGLATDPCEAVKLPGPAADLAISVLNE